MKNKYSFTKDFIDKLIHLSGGFFSREEFDNLLSLFEKEVNSINYFTYSSESNLLRIITSSFDTISLLNDCIKYPHHIEILVSIAVNSNYLTDITVMNPEYLYQIFDTSYLKRSINKESIEKEIFDGINRFKSMRAKLNYLRSVKKRFTLKIGVNDILKNIKLEEVTNEISVLAKAILKFLFELCLKETEYKYKIELPKKRYSLCALGKLGGDELNYSSDVDLILFYDNNKELAGSSSKEYYEILSEATQLFIQSSTELTDKGFLYRIDFRLRPDGKNSPLCRTINDYLRYYETRGEDWERQMLIKLSFIDGDEELYKSFSKYLSNYVYPSSFSNSPIEQIKKLRKSIENKIGKKEDVKLFAGGIRDIEFSVQALQLLNGGKKRSVRTGKTLTAVKELHATNILSDKEADLYTKAYTFYRRIEHFLQLMNDTQTHEIPSGGEILTKLAGFMNFKNPESFKEQMNFYRKEVRSIYNLILNTDDIASQSKMKLPKVIKFENGISAEKNYKYLKTGAGLLEQKEFDSKIINLFLEIKPVLFKYLLKSAAPDKVLDNFVRIIKSTSFHSIWYSEFTNPKFFEIFLRLCEFSQKAVNLISNDKMCAELIISRRAFTTDLHGIFDKLEISKLYFILSVQFALNLINVEKLSKILSDYIAFKLDKICKEQNIGFNFFIAGLGSFGIGEMNFSSDVDLIVVTDKIDENSNIQNAFQKYLITAKKELKEIDVDFRLRPEGKNSPLVWDIEAYGNYINTRARIWEFQALHKLRFVSGDKKLFISFKKIIRDRLRNLDHQMIKKELKEMFEKTKKKSYGTFESLFDLKKSKGGLINIDFIIQSILLLNSELYYKTIGKNTRTNIMNIIKSVEETEDIKKLLQPMKFLKTCVAANQNIFDVKGSQLKEDDNSRIQMYRSMKIKSMDKFNGTLKDSVSINNELLQKYLMS